MVRTAEIRKWCKAGMTAAGAARMVEIRALYLQFLKVGGWTSNQAAWRQAARVVASRQQ